MSDYFTAVEMNAALARQNDMYKAEDGSIDLTATGNLQLDLDDVEEFINSSVRNKYKIPITNPRSVKFIKGAVLVLMREKAYERLGTGEIPEAIIVRADRIRFALAQIMTGPRILSDEEESASGPLAEVAFVSTSVELSREKLEGY